MDKFRRIKTLEQAENICKFAFGKKIVLLTETVEEMKANGLQVRVHEKNCYYCFTILNEFETDCDEETTENLRFAMGVIYGDSYFTDLKSFMHNKYFAEPFNKVSQRVAFYKAKHKKTPNDEADNDLKIKKNGFIFIKNTNEIYRIVDIAFSHNIGYKVHVPINVDLSNNPIDVEVEDALGGRHPYTIYNDFESSNKMLTHDMRCLLAKKHGELYINCLREYEKDETVVKALIKELNNDNETE